MTDNDNSVDELELDDGVEIELEDDVPEQDKPRLSEDHKADIPDDDEVEKYSEGVQKRIKKLKFEYHEAERQKQEAIRVREEAVAFAKQVADQNKQLSERLSSGQQVVIDNVKSRYTTELEQAKRDYKVAYEAGDTDALLDAQQRLIRVQSDMGRAETWKPQKIEPQAVPETLNTPPAPQLNTDQKEWLSENQWFGQDSEMTGAAYGLHETLVRNGVDPNSKTYYAKINEGMRKRFPEKFDDGTREVEVPAKKMANVVAPAARSGNSPRKVKLTSTQLALARRLGIKPEVYAAQMLKDARNG